MIFFKLLPAWTNHGSHQVIRMYCERERPPYELDVGDTQILCSQVTSESQLG